MEGSPEDTLELNVVSEKDAMQQLQIDMTSKLSQQAPLHKILQDIGMV